MKNVKYGKCVRCGKTYDAVPDLTNCECELKSNPSLCMEKGRIVGYDRRKFENEAECCTALIHEDGHFESGAFYKPFSVYQVKQQAENKAWRSAFRKRIPWCELKGEILKGFSVWEIAEHFNVTAQCIWDAYLYYRDVCGVCMQEDT